jgi:hypothetical protein
MLRRVSAVLCLILLLAATPQGAAADYCDRYTFGSPEWWDCIAQDRETGS